MKERPILFTAPMVRALVAGTKTQTRRVVKPQFTADAIPVEMPATDPAGGWVVPGHSGAWWCDAAANPDDVRRCPYGQPGDRLWVRETFGFSGSGYIPDIHFRATNPEAPILGRWHPSIHMRRIDSRITLEITSVRVERLQDISEADAMAEGIVECPIPADDEGPRRIGYMVGPDDGKSGLAVTAANAYRELWEQINGPDSWAANPWVWAIEFRRVP